MDIAKTTSMTDFDAIFGSFTGETLDEESHFSLENL